MTTSPITPSLSNEDLARRLDAAEARYRRSERRFRIAGGVLLAAITLFVVAPMVSPAVAQGYGVTLATLNTRLTAAEATITTQQTAISALQTKTASMNVLTDPATNQPTVRFTNVNVQVVSGSGETEGTANGRGNLIVGYNEVRGANDIRTGSHNLVAGTFNNYSSGGGVVFGYNNTISGLEPSVLGGEGNTASGEFTATVSGGNRNTASGIDSCVSGGVQNTASGPQSSVSGGFLNTASGDQSSITGGDSNRAFGSVSSIVGGQNLSQSNDFGFSAGGDGGVGTYHTP